jgi:hypothetical protein
MKYNEAIIKHIEGISVYSLKLKKKNKKLNTKIIEAKLAVFLSKISFANKYVKVIESRVKQISNIFAEIIRGKPNFQIKPNKNGSINGRINSNTPVLPFEKMNFPVPI